MTKEDIEIEEGLEITEVTAGAALVRLPGKVISVFPAFAYRNYQLYFAGQFLSVIGFWLQIVGVGWLVFNLTQSPFWVGISAASFGIPFLFLTTFAGVFVDKLDKQKLIIRTQIIEMVLAALLGVLVLTGNVNLTMILIISLSHGTIASVDLPARLSFLVEMVGKRDLGSAVALNSALFNVARFIGPALAGVLIISVGVGWTFILNSVSFLPAVWTLYLIRPIYSYKADMDTHPFESLKRGVKYTFSHPKLYYFMILGTLTAIFIWPYQTLMPVISERIFNAGAGGLGSLLSSAGAGSVLGALFTSAFSRKINGNILILTGIIISTISLIIFSLNHNFFLAHILLVFAGFGVLMQVATINTLVQLASPDQMRGRIMAVYLTMFIGMFPIGNVIIGTLAQKTSSLFAIGLGASTMLLATTILYLKGAFVRISQK